MVAKVIFVTGEMGTGKTSVSQQMSKQLGWRLCSIDALRKEIAGDTSLAWQSVWTNIQDGVSIVVDATGASPFFHLIRRRCGHLQIPTTVIRLLRKEASGPEQSSPKELIKLHRGGPSRSYIKLSIRGIDADITLDTTTLAPAQAASLLLQTISTNTMQCSKVSSEEPWAITRTSGWRPR